MGAQNWEHPNRAGFLTGVEGIEGALQNLMGGGGGETLSQYMGGAWGDA